MQRQTVTRLCAGMFVVVVLSVSGRNLWKRHQRQELLEAAQHRDEATVKRLLLAGVPPGAGVPRGQNRPIHFAVNNRETEALLLLMAYPTEINAPDEQGRTPLFLAIATLPDPVLTKLLDSGALPYTGGGENQSCLTRAAILGRKAAIPILLTHGAEVDAKDRNDETALIAALRGALSPVNLRMPPLNPPFQADYLGVVQGLLEAGANPNRVDTNGMTPLMQVALSPPNDLTLEYGKLLLARGAAVDARMGTRIDSEGRTALMLAANAGNIEFVKLLLAHGAAPKMRSYTGKTARDYALRSREQKQLHPLHSPKPTSSASTTYPVPSKTAARFARLDATLALLDTAIRRDPNETKKGH